jgi:hypothetical protein
LILGIGTPMIGKFFVYDALTLMMKTVETGKNPDCPLCGETPKIKALIGEGSVSYRKMNARYRHKELFGAING